MISAILETLSNLLFTHPAVRDSRIIWGPVREGMLGKSAEQIIVVDEVAYNVTVEEAHWCDACNGSHGFRCPNNRSH